MKQIVSILIILFFFSKPAFSQTGSLKLSLSVLHELQSKLNSENITISLPANKIADFKFPKGDTIINKLDTGFCLVSIHAKAKFKSLDKYLSALFVISIPLDSTVELKENFPVDCNFNNHAFNNVCPKCKKSDKVLPVEYGFSVPIYTKKGKAVNSHRSMSATCSVTNCDPSWYCERDKIKF